MLESPSGGAAKGRVIVYIATNTGDVAFNVRATEVPETQEGQAYGVWLVGGDRPHFLGFAPPVGKNGRLAVSGPRDSDAANFAQLAREREADRREHGDAGGRQDARPARARSRLSGEAAGAAATPTPYQQLSRVHDARRVEPLLERAQQLDRARILALQPRRVVAPDRVVVGERAAVGDDRVARRGLVALPLSHRIVGLGTPSAVKYSDAPVG